MKEIIATEGNWLTQQTLTDESSRTFGKKVFTPNEAMWIEWSDEQKVEWEEAHPVVEPSENEVSDSQALDEINTLLNE